MLFIKANCCSLLLLRKKLTGNYRQEIDYQNVFNYFTRKRNAVSTKEILSFFEKGVEHKKYFRI